MKGAAFDIQAIGNLRKIKQAEYKPVEHDPAKDFYVVCTDLAKDGQADTAVIVARVSIGDYRFTYRFVNLFTIDSSDYEVVANILKQTVTKYDARMLIYDANGIGASLREWLNKPTIAKDGLRYEGLGIINPPDANQVIHYRDSRLNICYEIKSGGSKASEIHRNFFGKMSNGSIRLLVKSADALSHFKDIKNFALANNRKKDAYMRPYQYTDLLETELKNLDIKDTSDAVNSYIVIVQRNKNIQKDFFSAAEYLVYAVGQHIEMPYYIEKKKKENKRQITAFISGKGGQRSNTHAIEARRRKRR